MFGQSDYYYSASIFQVLNMGILLCVYLIPYIIDMHIFLRHKENSIMKLSDPRTQSLLINFLFISNAYTLKGCSILFCEPIFLLHKHSTLTLHTQPYHLYLSISSKTFHLQLKTFYHKYLLCVYTVHRLKMMNYICVGGSLYRQTEKDGCFFHTLFVRILVDKK